jgi:hypothetical protein
LRRRYQAWTFFQGSRILTFKRFVFITLFQAKMPFNKSAHLVNILLQDPERHNRVPYIVFMAEQCRALAVAGTRTDIGFHSCEFEDGDAFMEAFSAWGNSGPVKLRIYGRLPFHDERFVWFFVSNASSNICRCASLRWSMIFAELWEQVRSETLIFMSAR